MQACLKEHGSTSLKTSASLAELIRRPELSYEALGEIDTERPNLSADVCEEVNINIKYAGYLERQMKQVEQFRKMERKKIPADLDYETVPSLRTEARQKLSMYRPESIGQASRLQAYRRRTCQYCLCTLLLQDQEGRNNKDDR